MGKLLERENYNFDSLSEHVAKIVSKESGNILGENQASMVQGRLTKRLLELNLDAKGYFFYLRENYAVESLHLVSLLTTHHTFFFREFSHFDYLRDNLEDIISKVVARGDDTIRIYSAACSRGHEVYSLATFFEFHLKSFPHIKYEVFGSDIDPQSIKIANRGIYPFKEVKSIPKMYLSGNWQKGTGDVAHFAKIQNHIKANCKFQEMNLLNLSPLRSKRFDIILCRNVFIYFDDKTITKICKSLKTLMYPEALFITGLCENLKPLDFYKRSLASSVYAFSPPSQKNTAKEELPLPVEQFVKATSIIKKIPSPIRMLIVDDSPSIVKILTNIFNSDASFEVIGTAINGLEAKEFLQNNKVDAMTLDIHMPELNGVDYLQRNFNSSHPKVIMVSSASREDTRYAQKAIEYGASDFVEKPAMNNLLERADEIKIKIKSSFLSEKIHSSEKLTKSYSSGFVIKRAEEKARIFFSNYGDKDKILNILKDLTGEQPPLFIFFEGNMNYFEIILEDLKANNIKNCSILGPSTKITSNRIYICDFKEHFSLVFEECKTHKVSVSVLGLCSINAATRILSFKQMQLLIEETQGISDGLKNAATDIFPWTSFYHVATEYLSKDED